MMIKEILMSSFLLLTNTIIPVIACDEPSSDDGIVPNMLSSRNHTPHHSLPPSSPPVLGEAQEEVVSTSNHNLFHLPQNVDANIPSSQLNEDIEDSGDESEDQDLVSNFSGMGLEEIPSAVFGETQVTMLDLSKNNLSMVSSQITRLVNLEGLNVSLNELRKVPDLRKLLKLSMVILSQNNIKTVDLSYFPPELGVLDLSDNDINNFSYSSPLIHLQVLNLANNKLKYFPLCFFKNSKLHELDASWNKIELIPNKFNETPDLVKLNVSHNKLEELPSSIFRLDLLEYLDASHNQIQTIPKELNLPNLQCLNVCDNPVGDNRDYIKRLFKKCPNLEAVILTHEIITRKKGLSGNNSLVYTPMEQSTEPSPSYLSDEDEDEN